MKIQKKLAGATIAAAVALTFVSTPLIASAQDSDQTTYKWVKCYGINSCQGKSACYLTSNECHVINPGKGQNSCRGKGFVWKTPENCKIAGGSAPETPERMK